MKNSCPMTSEQVIDEYFLEYRGKLIELAAFLDRVQRGENPSAAETDFRMIALRQALAVLNSKEENKAQKIQMILSDPTTTPLASASGLKGASGAYQERK